MELETKYSYENSWTHTKEEDLLKIIEEELGDADIKGTLLYVKEKLKSAKVIGIGSCKFRTQKRG